MVQPLRLPLCPRCQQALARERVTCRSCGAAHHPECWVQGRGCGFYACGGNPSVAPPPERPVRLVARDSALQTPSGVSVPVGLAAAAACVLFGLFAWMPGELPAPPPGAEDRPAAALPPSAELAPPGLFIHDLRVDLAGTGATLAWSGQRAYEPTFRHGRDGPDAEAPVERVEVGAGESRSFRVKLANLLPGVTYTYRIGGFPGGPQVGRFTTLPPGDPHPVTLRANLLDLPAGASAVAASFGRDRRARPLWMRSAGAGTGAVAAPGRIVLHDGRHLQVLDLPDARPLWAHPVPAGACAPIVVDGLAIAATPHAVHAFDLETGRPRFKLPLPHVRALVEAAGELHVQVAGESPRLFRVLVPEGQVVSVIPLPIGLRELVVCDTHVVLALEESPNSRDVLVRTLDRLRGERRWERLLAYPDVPALPLFAHAGRLVLAFASRVEARSLEGGEVSAKRTLDAPPVLALPLRDGGALVATAGPAGAFAHHLDAALAPRRVWRLPAPPHSGAVTRDRAALVDPHGVQLLELAEGPCWGVTGLPPLTAVHLTEDGCLVAGWRDNGDQLLALGLR
jgi:hypothetical protein